MLSILLVLSLLPLVFSLSLLWEGLKERDSRAVRGTMIPTLSLSLLVLLLLLPPTRPVGTTLILLIWGVALALLVPRRPSPKATEAFIVGKVERVDEREIPFARIRSIRPGTEQYRAFYSAHPELEGKDARRREVGLLGSLGKIDGQYEPLTAMIKAAMAMPLYLSRPEVYEPEPQGDPREVDPWEITLRIKGLARHLGANLVGICRLNPLWVYSHRGEIFHGNWEDWGRPIGLDHPYAVVIATEMCRDLLRAAPRTPTTVESAVNYAKGAYIATAIAHYIAQLGHRVRAQHFRHYDLCLGPLGRGRRLRGGGEARLPSDWALWAEGAPGGCHHNHAPCAGSPGGPRGPGLLREVLEVREELSFGGYSPRPQGGPKRDPPMGGGQGEVF